MGSTKLRKEVRKRILAKLPDSQLASENYVWVYMNKHTEEWLVDRLKQEMHPDWATHDGVD